MSVLHKISEVQLKVLKNSPTHKKVELKKETPSTTTRHIEDNTPNTESVHQEEVKVSFLMNGFIKEASSLNEMIHSNKPLKGIPGGKANKTAPNELPANMLRKGVKIEKEHTPSKKKALEIATDHTKEFPNYYAKLPAFERSLSKKASLNDLYMRKYAFLEAKELITQGKGFLGRAGKAIKESFKVAPKKPITEAFGGKPWYEVAGHGRPNLAKAQDEFKSIIANRKTFVSPQYKASLIGT